LSARLRIKIICGSEHSLIKQHLALEMSTSRTAHAERERERERRLQNNIKAKPEQLKLSKTYPST
jgi:hypothetical protein